MGLALYRKYRPKRLDDVVGQDVIITTLKNALKTHSLSHAYLFTGPRGVGKTSIARILAHEINNIPYNDDSMHLDIIEIDAASNRRIDEIRELRDKIHIAPTSAAYKVYIIDEVHMLTKEAFNALLKTLEEPPKHAIFILATTEAHKVPDTIISRTQRFTFKPIDNDTIANHLLLLAKKENIRIDKAAALALAERSGGSFRDAINLLDQSAATSTHITKEVVLESLGAPKDTLLGDLRSAIDQNDARQIITILQTARTEGIHAPALATSLANHLRDTVLAANTVTVQDVQFLQQLNAISGSLHPYIALELALLKQIAQPTMPAGAQATQQSIGVNEPKKPVTSVEAVHETAATEPIVAPTAVDKAAEGNSHDDTKWGRVLTDIKTSHNTLYGVLRMASVSESAQLITLVFQFPFHQKQITQARSLEKVIQTVREVYGNDYNVTCVVNKNGTTKPKAVKHQSANNPSTAVTDISNIFNGAELLEY